MDPCMIPLWEEGSARPLFLVEGVGDARTVYGGLVKCLGRGRKVYGLEGPFQPDGAHEFVGIEERARLYLRAIRGVQAEGPYLLGGYCLGGNIAYAMARLLAVEEEQTAFLVLFDCEAPPRGTVKKPRLTARLRTLPRKLGAKAAIAWHSLPRSPYHFRDLLALLRLSWKGSADSGIPAPSIREAFLYVWRNARLQCAFVAGGCSRELLTGVDCSFATIPRFWLVQRRARAGGKALEEYNRGMQPFSQKITLFVSKEECLANPGIGSTMGWEEWAQGGVDAHVVGGNHEMLLHAPHVEAVAAEIQSALNTLDPAPSA